MKKSLVMVNIVFIPVCHGVVLFYSSGMAGAMMMELPSNPLQNMDPQEYLNR